MKIFPQLSRALIYCLLSGCATVGGMKDTPISDGSEVIVETTLQRALILTRQALPTCGLELKDEESYNSRWVIVADSGASATSWGELVRVAGEPKNEEQTIIRVIAERRLAVNYTADPDKYKKCVLQTIELTALKEKISAPH